jgi:hypothetical protein
MLVWEANLVSCSLTDDHLGPLQAGKILGIGLCHFASWVLVAHAGDMPEATSQPILNSGSRSKHEMATATEDSFGDSQMRGAWFPTMKASRRVQMGIVLCALFVLLKKLSEARSTPQRLCSPVVRLVPYP